MLVNKRFEREFVIITLKELILLFMGFGVMLALCTIARLCKKTLGYKSCPNLFRDHWLDWLIDEAHKHDMQVHAYFEKGIKIDKK